MADGTGVLATGETLAVATHRFAAPLVNGPQCGMHWWTDGVGVAAMKVYISSQTRNKEHMKVDGKPDLDPSSNRWWFFIESYKFVDGTVAATEAVPDGATVEGYLALTDVAGGAVMIEVVVSTEVENFNLGFFGGGIAL